MYLKLQKRLLKNVAVEKLSDFKIERARKVMDDKRNHTLATKSTKD